jgi:hypothetical protein
MDRINLITPPDILRTDATNWLFIFPRKDILSELQDNILKKYDGTVNLYYYDLPNYSKEDVEWLLNVFALADTVVIDIDNCEPYIIDLMSYFVSKSKTYWLTMRDKSLYTHISSNRIYNLSFLQTGDEIEKATEE